MKIIEIKVNISVPLSISEELADVDAIVVEIMSKIVNPVGGGYGFGCHDYYFYFRSEQIKQKDLTKRLRRIAHKLNKVIKATVIKEVEYTFSP